MLTVLVFFTILISFGAEGQERCRVDNEEVTSCKECLWTAGCEWCNDPDPAPTGFPIGANSNNIALGCIKANGACKDVKQSTIPESNQNRDQSIKQDISRLSESDRSQLAPRLLNRFGPVKINPTQEAEVLFRIKPETEHPVDLYFVMDLSNSMKPYKNSLVETASSIAAKIEETTPKFRMGFGSFSDKPTAPFSAELSYYTGGRKAPYAFHHVQNLTVDSAEFIRLVRSQDTRGNVDSPESGMDALMQAIVCDDHIWKSGNSDESARKIIIFVTDQSSHYALDGLLGGIVTPADEACHLVFCPPGNTKTLEGCAGSENVYSYADQLTRDYPSFSQVRKVINEKNMNVIFAVTQFMKPIYDKLAEFLGQKNNVGELPKVENNIVSDTQGLQKLIVDQYNQIRGKVKVIPGGNDDLTMTFKQMGNGGNDPSSSPPPDFKCPTDKSTKQEFECTGVPAGKKGDKRTEIWGKAFIGVTKEKCQSLNGTMKSEEIKLFGNSEDIIRFDYKCEECDNCGTPVRNAPECSNEGMLVCGGCSCNPGRKGRFCQCDTRNAESIDIDQCRRPQSQELCSGKGKCSCGSCECQQGYTGRCCQIKMQTFCGGDNDLVCSGNGKCVETGQQKCEQKAECQCNTGASEYSKDKCQCCEKGECKRNCFDRFSNPKVSSEMCSGHGKCDCENGRNGETCKCDLGWGGKFCQIREDNEEKCQLLEPCVNYRLSYDPRNPNKQWEKECKNNLAELGYKGPKASGVGVGKTRIACQASEDGKLSDSFQLLKDFKGENGVNYCNDVLGEVKSSKATNSESEDESSVQSKYWDIKQQDFTQCEMYSLEDSSCKVRFYHNNIDANKHFENVDNLQEDDTFIYVVKHNGTEDGKWQYHVQCNPIPVTTILISTIGTFFAICLGLLISAVVIINVNDYRSYKKFLANKKETEEKLKMMEMSNPQFQPAGTTTDNPLHGK